MKHNYSEVLKAFKLQHFVCMIVVLMATLMCTSCSDESEPDSGSGAKSLVGTWVYQEFEEDSYGTESVVMTLTFNSNNTGKIVEDWSWSSNSKAESSDTYKMEFSWSTTTDSSGNDILRISYVSGDKNTELFYGEDNTALWTRQYVLTGKILNIYSGSSNVWVFNKK